MTTTPPPTARRASGPRAGAAASTSLLSAGRSIASRTALGRGAVARTGRGTHFRAVCRVLGAALAAALGSTAVARMPAAASEPASAAVHVRPAPAPAAGALAAWHRRYLPHARPVRMAMKRMLAARRTADPTDYKRRYRQACRSLAEALAPFADPERRDALFPAADADPAAHYHLRRAYAGLSGAAAAGAEGRFQAAELAFADAARWFQQAARVLERYGLEP